MVHCVESVFPLLNCLKFHKCIGLQEHKIFKKNNVIMKLTMRQNVPTSSARNSRTSGLLTAILFRIVLLHLRPIVYFPSSFFVWTLGKTFFRPGLSRR